MGADIDKEGVERAYARWAPIYDAVFGKVFAPGRAAAIAAADAFCGPAGGRILDVGVGTGISLPAYRSREPAGRRRSVRADAAQAVERVAEHKLTQCRGARGDGRRASRLPDGAFDVVVAQFVITAVPHPESTLDEFVRVTREGGEIILVNHIGAERGPRRLFEMCFAPLARRLGWRPEFPFARLTDWARRHGGVRMIEHRPLAPLGHFSLIRFKRLPGAERQSAA